MMPDKSRHIHTTSRTVKALVSSGLSIDLLSLPFMAPGPSRLSIYPLFHGHKYLGPLICCLKVGSSRFNGPAGAKHDIAWQWRMNFIGCHDAGNDIGRGEPANR